MKSESTQAQLRRKPKEKNYVNEASKAIARRLVDAINGDDEAAFLEVLVPDVVDHYSLRDCRRDAKAGI